MTPGRRSPLAVALLIVIRLYRVIRQGRPSPCRFTPTCSAFGAEAIITYGAVRGGWLTLRRVARCRPGGGMGFDPVPTPEPHVHDSPTTRKAAHV